MTKRKQSTLRRATRRKTPPKPKRNLTREEALRKEIFLMGYAAGLKHS